MEEVTTNKCFSGERITVEWISKELKLCYNTMDHKRNLKMNESPAGVMYKASMLLFNMRNCFYPNHILQ